MGEQNLNFLEKIDYTLTNIPYQIYTVLSVVALLVTCVTIYDYATQQQSLQEQLDLDYQMKNIVPQDSISAAEFKFKMNLEALKNDVENNGLTKEAFYLKVKYLGAYR